jgi:hypothetical protein
MIRKLLVAFSLSLTLAAIPSALPSSKTATQAVTITPVIQQLYELQVSGGYHVNIEKGNAWKLSITGSQEAIDKIVVSQATDTLSLSPINEQSSFMGKLFNFRDEDSQQYQVAINLTVPALASIRLLGSSSADIGLGVNIIDITLSGDSALAMQDQTAPRINASLHGTSSLKATTLQADSITLALHGSTTASILAAKAQQRIMLGQAGNSKLNIGQLRTIELSINTSGHSTTGIGHAETSNAYVDNHGGTVTQFNHIESRTFAAKLSGAASLTIEDGQSLKSQISTSGKAEFNITGDFSSGIMDKKAL